MKRRALKRRYGHASRKPSRKEMITALGLEPETRHRGMTGVAIGRYAATTAEFWHKIKYGTSEVAKKEARQQLGLPSPTWQRTADGPLPRKGRA